MSSTDRINKYFQERGISNPSNNVSSTERINNYFNERKTSNNRKHLQNKVKNLQKKYTNEFDESERKKDLWYKLTASGNKAENEFRKTSETYKEYQTYKRQLDDLDYQIQKEKSDKEKITTTERILLPIINETVRASEGIKTSINKVSGQNNVEPQINSNEIRYEKLKKETKNPIERIYQDLTSSIGGMIPSMVTGNPTASLLTTGLSSAGRTYNQAKRDGKSESQATNYGIVNGAMEAGLQKVLGGISSVYGNSIVGSKVSNTVGKLIKNPTVSKLVSEAGSEFTEEYLQEILDPVVRNITMNEKNEFKPFTEEALYSGMLGALNSGLINGSNIAVNKMQQKALSNPIVPINKKNIINDVDRGIIKKNQKGYEGLQSSNSSNLVSSNNIPQNSNIVNNSNMQQSQNNVPMTIEMRLSNAYDNALNNKTSNRKTFLGKTNDFAISKVKQFFGTDITNKNHVLLDNDIRHMLNRHGNDTKTTNGKQLDITKDDIVRIPEIISNPDDIIIGSKNKNRSTGKTDDSIRYIKTYDNNKSYVIEVIPDKGNSLKIKTMWKEPVGVSHDINVLPYTSETKSNLSISTSIDNIPQNSNIVNNSNMQQEQNNSYISPITKESKKYFLNSTDNIVKMVESLIESDKVTDSDIDELIYDSSDYEDGEDFDEIYNEVSSKLEEKGITSRYDKGKDKNFYDRQGGAEKGYNELLTYLDKNNVDYEVSKSTEAGYVPSIYIKDSDGDTIYRIANHDNDYIDDFDMVYDEKYNQIFDDEDYINWKDNIIPYINRETDLFKNQINDNHGSKVSKGQETTKLQPKKSIIVPISKELHNKTADLLDRRPEQAKKTVRDSIELTKQQLVNKGHYIDKLAKKTDNKELTYKYDKMLSSPAEGHYSIGVSQTDNNGNKIGKSIIDIWQPVEKANKVREFSDYLLNKHNIDRVAQGKPVFGDNVTAEMSSDKVLQYEKTNPQFKDWANDINTYNKNQLQNMVDAGLTSQDTQKYLNETYDNYVRINRDIKGNAPITNSSGNLKVNVPIKKAKGGNQDILPLKESMAQQTLEIKNAIRRNEFGLELLNTLQNGEQDLEYDGKNYVLKNDDGTYSFTVFKDGTPIKIEIDEGIYNSVKPTGKHAWEEILPVKVAQKVSNIQRNLLTVDNPLFVLTNFFKDIGDAPFNSKYASKFYPNYIKAANEIKNNGELWQKYRALGGEQNTYFTKEKGITPLAQNKAKKFIDKINKVNEAVEQAPRLAEFISTLEAGGTLNEAMYNAAEVTTNFKRGGDVSKALNRNGFTFLNASIQGFDKQIRNFTGQNGAKGYINLLSKASMLGVIPSLLNNMLLGDDDDYKNLPDYVKDTYYLFKTHDDNFIRIPKGRIMSVFGSAARRTTELGENKKSFDGFGDLLVNQVAPNNPLEDNVIAPITAVKNNRSWNGSEIVPRRLQDELPENQYDEKTDAISKVVGKAFKVSPKKVNYLLDQYTGGIGDFILPMITPKAQQNPLSAKFTTNSTMNNKNVSLFFDNIDKTAKIKNSQNATDEDKLRYKYLTAKQKEMNDLYQEKREIEMSSLNNKEKMNSVKEVQKKINQIAKTALESKDDISVDTNYSKVADIQFYKNSENEWQKITDKMLEKQQEVEKTGFLPNTYYKNYVELNSISSSDKDKYVKKSEIINHILNEDITDKQMAFLYGQYYSKPETMELLSKSNISISAYLTLQDKIKDAKAIDDPKSNVDGKTISGSKKRQIINEISKLPISAEEKLVLIALEGYSVSSKDNIVIKKRRVNSRQFKGAIFNYVNRQPLTAKEKREILEKAGYTFYENGKLRKTW